MRTDAARPVSPIVSFLLLFLSSFVAAAVFYGLLKSTGTFKSEGTQLGGAAAGFIVFFAAFYQAFSRLEKRHQSFSLDQEKTGLARQVETLQDTIEKLRSGELPPVDCPPGYEVFVPRDYGIAFSRPATWEPRSEKTLLTIMRPVVPGEEVPFRGNINITATPIKKEALERLDAKEKQAIMAALLEHPIRLAAKHFNAEDVQIDEAIISGKTAISGTFHYDSRAIGGLGNTAGTIVADVTVVLDAESSRLFIVALHEMKTLAEASRRDCRRLISTVRFLK